MPDGVVMAARLAAARPERWTPPHTVPSGGDPLKEHSYRRSRSLGAIPESREAREARS
jgi:hypothetical protein